MLILRPIAPAHVKRHIRIGYSVFLLIVFILTAFATFIINTKTIALDSTIQVENTTRPFPVGVDPVAERIVEHPEVDSFFEEYVIATTEPSRKNWFAYTLAMLTQFDWYQNLASPTARILVINPGQRKEQVVANFAKILKWDNTQAQEFLTLVTETPPQIADGTFYPANYMVTAGSSPKKVAELLTERFDSEILARYDQSVSQKVTLEDALIIASILEREAYDFTDMREISGVIWNRLFIDMNLQIDATLQYAKGTQSATSWWPVPRPKDKYIESPFNTYQNAGLPPAPISNPTSESVLAALNPKITDCIFYFHDSKSQFHCSPTYEGHVKLLKQYYGQGK